MKKLAQLLLQASEVAEVESLTQVGTEQVRLRELSRILSAEARVARQKAVA